MKTPAFRGGSALGAWCAALLLVAGCNPCNDREGAIQNVNSNSFPGPDFHVVTYNLLHGFGDAGNDATLADRLGIVVRRVVETTPDAVLFQEVSVTAPEAHCSVIATLVGQVNEQLAGEGKSYNAVYARANGDADVIGFEEGSAIISRHEILAADKHVYTHNATSLPEFRIALRATVRGAAGDIDLFSTHLTNREDTEGAELVRTLQARELTGEIIPGRGNTNPVMVGGDFNDPPGSFTIHEMTAAGAVDAFAASNPGVDGYTSFDDPFDLTDPGEQPDERIDYLFLLDAGATLWSSGLFLDAAADIDPGPDESWLWASDHIGVHAWVRPSGY